MVIETPPEKNPHTSGAKKGPETPKDGGNPGTPYAVTQWFLMQQLQKTQAEILATSKDMRSQPKKGPERPLGDIPDEGSQTIVGDNALPEVETTLALGATPRQATHYQVKKALVLALSPVLDNAKMVGLISLPGAMIGLIMGGVSPLEAIQLQIVFMNMLIGASTVSSITSTYLCWPAFFTKAFQLETKVFSDD